MTTSKQIEKEEAALGKFYSDVKFTDEFGPEKAVNLSQEDAESEEADDAKPLTCRARRKALRALKFGGAK